ncbi:MAG: thiazole biosynthesis adenylyltransferase ThiF [Planctomycetota bacterium]|mgnify:CR=1 FL=1|nr:MAG: thiazole biosynthesis adenylyltransferase ThiF [Planctomycetota bacterium]REJ95838.1 MAG: thiazole biosynthesis adenylyltransferase ThiF [Planctomycetota bacterium]REK25549.1 MAG: thiazole biosynthesis adenylyltransferase ThiF [Planctomycetota bacterium]REK31739.1 MAG: thiazole biosynthesis adenylyltransferase ThiF [Planctomycetota bacterium]
MIPPEFERYQKQVLFAGIGEEGQRRITQSRALLIGCGALGSVIADQIVRAGVGFIRLVDRDFVELSNLQRQVLYDEQDVADQLPKAVAAERKLRRINSAIEIESVVADVNHTNILELADGVDVILDGTDNFEVRFLINDASLETGIPWVNGGCIGSHGQVMTIIPGRTACLRCLITGEPEPGATETCDTAGVLGPAVNVVSSLQTVDALKLLSGQFDAIDPVLTVIDVWDGTMRRLKLGDLPEKTNCPACRGGERKWLRGEQGARTTVLCGRNAVQVSPGRMAQLSLDELSTKLRPSGEVTANPFLLKLKLKEPDCEITVFRDGRAIIKGTDDVAAARSLYSRYIGS